MSENIVVAGMHRTGHHPIAVWLLHQQPDVYDFAIKTMTSWLFQVESDQGVGVLANNPLKRGPEEHPDKEKFDQIMQELNPHRIVLTHEQEKLSQVAFACGHSTAVWEPNNKPKMVIILRDFKNWIASCIKMAERDNKPVKDILNEDKINTYKDHFRYINQDTPGIHYILYNQWVEDSGYRRRVCDKLGLHFTDAAVNQLSIFGGGSSFDEMKYIKTAWQMKTNKRYKMMKDNPFYKAILHNHVDALLLSNEVFGKYL